MSAPAFAVQAENTPTELKKQVEDLRGEVESLRVEMAAMRRAYQAATVPLQRQSSPVAIAASPPVQSRPALSPPAFSPPAFSPASPSAVQIAVKGAPEFRSADGWSFKPRGRVQFDAGYLDAPRAVETAIDGPRYAAVLRRAYVGAQGTIPGGFSYRAEIDLAPKTPEWTDLFIAYDRGPLNITVGQINPFTGIEQMSSDLFPSFTERAAFTGAFNYRRRVGLSAGYGRKTWIVNLGVFGDSVADVLPDGSRAASIDGRAIWMPKYGALQLHVAGSAHIRHYFKYPQPNAIRYRSRPYFFSTATRPIETDTLNVEDERNYGLELAAIRNRVHIASEVSWLQSRRANDIHPTYYGGYAEAGLFLTDDTRTYKSGQFDRVVPRRPMGTGGIGAIEVNARYDYLDLTDSSSIFAGRQQSLGASVIWTPVAYVRFTADYVHNHFFYRGFPPNADVEAATVRAQVDF